MFWGSPNSWPRVVDCLCSAGFIGTIIKADNLMILTIFMMIVTTINADGGEDDHDGDDDGDSDDDDDDNYDDHL